MTGPLLVVGLGAVAAGGLLAAARASFPAGLGLQAVGAACAGAAGFWALATGDAAGAAFASGLSPRLGLDALSGFFLGTLGLVACAALVFSRRYLDPGPRGRLTGVLTAPFVLSLALVLCARDPLTLLAGWELMTLLPVGLILVARASDRHARRTVFTYLSITHVGGVGTWVALLLLADAGAIGNPAAIAPGSGLQAAVALAALVGMGTKAGVMPFHVWLPRAHPIAPAPVSALMSGLMVNVALYLLVRVLVEWLGVLPAWIGVVTLALGMLSALGGVLYALFQRDLKRLLALSTIENVGIVVLGLGASLVLRARGQDAWAAFALAAALLHTLNHAVAKALLFLGAGAFERVAGTLRLDGLGGLLRRMPWTGGAFLVGALALAGVPPLNGFVSEWLTLQALIHVAAAGGLGDGLAGAVALAALAATAGLAALCLVSVIGLVLLGQPRTARVAAAADAARSMRAAVAALALACVVLGLAPGLLLAPLAGLAPAGAELPAQVGVALPQTGSLPTLAIALVLAAATVGLVLARGARSAAPAPTWACGQAVGPELRWTNAGFTKPLRLMLEGVLRPRREIAVRGEAGRVHEVSYAGEVPPLIDERLYRPVVRLSLMAARHGRRLQSGSLGMYAAYLIALVMVLLAGARLGVIG